MAVTSNYTQTRGWRNNNPLNIRHNKAFAWKGEELADNDGFCRFRNLICGIRAAICLIRSYNMRHRIYTLAEIINRFAPPSENHTDQYIAFVCKRTGYQPTTIVKYNSEECLVLLQAMAYYESRMEISIDKMKEAYLEVFR